MILCQIVSTAFFSCLAWQLFVHLRGIYIYGTYVRVEILVLPYVLVLSRSSEQIDPCGLCAYVTIGVSFNHSRPSTNHDATVRMEMIKSLLEMSSPNEQPGPDLALLCEALQYSSFKHPTQAIYKPLRTFESCHNCV